ETAASLAIDSRQMTGSDSRRKPITSELFDVLCDVAAARGHAHFGYINSDIVVLPALLEAIARRPCETYAISRCDVPDLHGNPTGGAMLTSGIDMFIVAVDWWRNERRRFRPYVVGEACWDDGESAM